MCDDEMSDFIADAKLHTALSRIGQGELEAAIHQLAQMGWTITKTKGDK